MSCDIDYLLSDHEALRRLVREHRLLKETIENRPLHVGFDGDNAPPDGGSRRIDSRSQQALSEAEIAAIAEARAEAEAASRRLVDAIDAMPEALAIFDDDQRLVICNERFRALYGVDDAEIEPGVSLESILRAGLEAGLFTEAKEREEAWLIEQLARFGDGNATVERPLAGQRFLHVHEQRADSGDVVECHVDMTALKRTQLQLERYARTLERKNKETIELSLHDGLTGLPNRSYLEQHLARRFSRASKLGTSIALIHLDVDRFKDVNDTIGHTSGNQLLKRFARLIDDDAPDDGFASRIGGDEFVVVLQDDVAEATLRRRAERLIELISAPVSIGIHECRVGVNAGVAVAGPDSEEQIQLLANADLALQKAKNEGRNRVAFFDVGMERAAREKKALADQLVAGIERGEFFPVYQPQYRAADLTLHGVEMLCRWRHPERGVLAPGAFLDLAQEMKVMGDIDRALFARAEADIEMLFERGVDVRKIAFNVTADRLLDGGLDDAMAGLRRWGVEVAVELVESMSLDDPGPMIGAAIERLRDRDIRIEIDDFGSCRASIVGLMNVKPHAMKIDRMIIQPIIEQEQHRRLARTLLEIGQSLDIEVVAEGVETMVHVALLAEMGCDVLQGYALARPTPIEDLPPLLSARTKRAAYAAE